MTVDFFEPKPDVALLVKNRLVEIMGERLFTQFTQAMRQSGAVLTGSFVLQCILGERWPESDIDFFVPEGMLRAPTGTQTSELDNWLFSVGVYKERGRLAAKMPHGEYNDVITGGEKTITLLRDYWLNDVKFQLVHINRPNTGDVCSWIETEFDFVIVKNSVWVDARGQWQWSVADWNAIETKSFTFQINRHLMSSLRRRAKYEERGFEIKHTAPRPLIERWAAQAGRHIPFIRFCDFKSKRPIFANTDDFPVHGARVRDREFTDTPLGKCWDSDCLLNQVSCWHMHSVLDRYGTQLVYIDKDALDIVRTGDVVIALQGLRFPALVLCLILKYVRECNTAFCNPARLWEIVKTIKNFNR